MIFEGSFIDDLFTLIKFLAKFQLSHFRCKSVERKIIGNYLLIFHLWYKGGFDQGNGLAENTAVHHIQ